MGWVALQVGAADCPMTGQGPQGTSNTTVTGHCLESREHFQSFLDLDVAAKFQGFKNLQKFVISQCNFELTSPLLQRIVGLAIAGLM